MQLLVTAFLNISFWNFKISITCETSTSCVSCSSPSSMCRARGLSTNLLWSISGTQRSWSPMLVWLSEATLTLLKLKYSRNCITLSHTLLWVIIHTLSHKARECMHAWSDSMFVDVFGHGQFECLQILNLLASKLPKPCCYACSVGHWKPVTISALMVWHLTYST